MTAAPSLTTIPSSSSSSSSRTSEKLPGSGFPFASTPVPRPVLEPSNWASSSSAAVRTGERRGVWAAEEERLGAACVHGRGVSMGPFKFVLYACAFIVCTQGKARKGRGQASQAWGKQRHVREADGRVRGGTLLS